MKLEEFLAHQEVKALLEKDYVLLSLDSGKHKNSKPVLAKLRGARGGGIPWMTILDADGKELVSGDEPTKGNIGCPCDPHEIAWFRKMLEQTKARLQPADLDVIERHNKAFADRWRGRPSGG